MKNYRDKTRVGAFVLSVASALVLCFVSVFLYEQARHAYESELVGKPIEMLAKLETEAADPIVASTPSWLVLSRLAFILIGWSLAFTKSVGQLRAGARFCCRFGLLVSTTWALATGLA